MAATAALSFDNAHTPEDLYVRDNRGKYRQATPAQIMAGARVAADTLLKRGPCLNQPGVVGKFLVAKLAGLEHEVVSVLFLDSRLQLISYLEMFSGTLSQASAHPREIVKVALRLNAGAVILAHNHPSGLADASSADIAITTRIKDALGLVDVQVLDHIIVAGVHTFSLAEKGLL